MKRNNIRRILATMVFFAICLVFSLQAIAVSQYNVTNLGSSKILSAINNQGQVAGFIIGNILFIYEDGITTEIGSLGSGEPHDINDFGKKSVISVASLSTVKFL